MRKLPFLYLHAFFHSSILFSLRQTLDRYPRLTQNLQFSSLSFQTTRNIRNSVLGLTVTRKKLSWNFKFVVAIPSHHGNSHSQRDMGGSSVVSCFGDSWFFTSLINSASYYLTVCTLLIPGVIWGLADNMKNSRYILKHLAREETIIKSHLVKSIISGKITPGTIDIPSLFAQMIGKEARNRKLSTVLSSLLTLGPEMESTTLCHLMQ